MSVSIGRVRGVLVSSTTIIDDLFGHHVPCGLVTSDPAWIGCRVDVFGEIHRDEKGRPVEVRNQISVTLTPTVSIQDIEALRGIVELAPGEAPEAAVRRLRDMWR